MSLPESHRQYRELNKWQKRTLVSHSVDSLVALTRGTSVTTSPATVLMMGGGGGGGYQRGVLAVPDRTPHAYITRNYQLDL